MPPNHAFDGPRRYAASGNRRGGAPVMGIVEQASLLVEPYVQNISNGARRRDRSRIVYGSHGANRPPTRNDREGRWQRADVEVQRGR